MGARICLQNRNDDSFPVAVTSECNWGVKFEPNAPAKVVKSEPNAPAKVVKSEPNAPAKLNHSVNFNSNLMGAVIGLDLRLPLAPSQWINAVVMCATDAYMVSLVTVPPSAKPSKKKSQ